MRFLRRSLTAIALAAGSFAAFGQNAMTPIAATSVNAGNSTVSGRLCFEAVNAYGNPIPVTKAGGGFYEAGTPFCQTLTNGALVGSLSIPDSETDSNPGHGYAMTIYNSSTQQTTTPLIITGITGSAAWSLDTYEPSATVAVPSPGLYAGTGVPTFRCTAPCVYIESNASNAAQAVYVVVAPAGTASTNWQLQGASSGGSSSSSSSTGEWAFDTSDGGSLTLGVPGHEPTVLINSGSDGGSGTVQYPSFEVDAADVVLDLGAGGVSGALSMTTDIGPASFAAGLYGGDPSITLVDDYQDIASLDALNGLLVAGGSGSDSFSANVDGQVQAASITGIAGGNENWAIDAEGDASFQFISLIADAPADSDPCPTNPISGRMPIAVSTTYFYVCTGAGGSSNWRRAALSTY